MKDEPATFELRDELLYMTIEQLLSGETILRREVSDWLVDNCINGRYTLKSSIVEYSTGMHRYHICVSINFDEITDATLFKMRWL